MQLLLQSEQRMSLEMQELTLAIKAQTEVMTQLLKSNAKVTALIVECITHISSSYEEGAPNDEDLPTHYLDGTKIAR
jgi:hypothetical protein